MSTRLVRYTRKPLLVLGTCIFAGMVARCGGAPITKDFNSLNEATRIEVHTSGVRPLSVVSDPERIKVAIAFIKQYEEGWKSPRWQGGVIPRRRFAFWNGDRYLGDFGISPSALTTDNYYQEAPDEEIARIAALFELDWPPRQ